VSDYIWYKDGFVTLEYFKELEKENLKLKAACEVMREALEKINGRYSMPRINGTGSDIPLYIEYPETRQAKEALEKVKELLK
jgi:hypothetical protein